MAEFECQQCYRMYDEDEVERHEHPFHGIICEDCNFDNLDSAG